MLKKQVIFWFRQDLRLSDNPGLLAAVDSGHVMPIYILDDETAGDFRMGAASRWWLHHSLHALNNTLNHQLNVYLGNAKDILLQIIEENNITAVYWNRCYEPWRIKADTHIKSQLKKLQIECKTYNGSLLWEPWDIAKPDGTPYKVYTPFYRRGCLHAALPRKPLEPPKQPIWMQDKDPKCSIEQLGLLPIVPWYKSIEHSWDIGEIAAQKKLFHFLENTLLNYKENRNYPSKPNTSRLSPHLHFGEISPNQVWYSAETQGMLNHWEADLDYFKSEIGWREFSYYLLYYFPKLPTKNYQSKFDGFEWHHNTKLLEAWQKGMTGYPIVDAGMRELWQTGYMHNRVRMIVGSFLVKNLLIHWHAGEQWFWDCLLDADLANNSANWQWIAGCGADAAPYFRIFNPVTQGEKFDRDGTYTRHFVPELKELPNQYLFKPWEAPSHILERAGVSLGNTYPHPIIDLKNSREKALTAYQKLGKK